VRFGKRLDFHKEPYGDFAQRLEAAVRELAAPAKSYQFSQPS
jgi:hypothetical protein